MNKQIGKVVVTSEMASVVAYKHLDNPTLKVQCSPDCPTDSTSTWSAFASSCGVAVPKFAGKSWKTQAAAERAIVKFLNESASRFVPANNIAPFVPNTMDEVLSH